jgi:hypothetical protein
MENNKIPQEIEETPQQIRNEVEKGCGEFLAMFYGDINYRVRCGDINPISKEKVLCNKCEAKLSILTEYDKSIKDIIKKDLNTCEEMIKATIKNEIANGKWISISIELKRLLSKIGDNSEVKE